MKKYQYILIYLATLVLPVTIVYIISLYRDFNIKMVQGIVLETSSLLAIEINARYQSKKFIWYYISGSVRDKTAFVVALIVFNIFLIYPALHKTFSSVIGTWLWILVSGLLASLIFMMFSSKDMQDQLLARLLKRPRSTSTGK